MKKQKTPSPWSIGIDLGTTNCEIASFHLANEAQTKAESFEIPQVIDQNMISPRLTLPSFLYQPAEHEREGQLFKLPWNESPAGVVGDFARQQAEKTPQRVISSAKSWLCVQGDRNAPTLPLSAPEDVTKLSPVEASARYLEHLREAWNQTYPDQKLEDQEIVLTVPASFDAVARELTTEAARQAKLGEVTLLEEPIAAFYAWIADHHQDWRKLVQVGDVILVCDIGGGTTDFSLIAVEEKEGDLTLTRIAVGEHILLGGDNMDLALARVVQTRLEQDGKTLEPWQFFALAHSCRKAKEQLLADAKLEEVPVVIPGRGSKLVGGTLRTQVTRAEAESVLLEGFFGACLIQDHPQSLRRTGLRTLGLNYATEPNVLKHLAKFLVDSRQFVEPQSPLAKAIEGQAFVPPTAILFNGGVTKAPLFQERVTQTVNRWLAEVQRPEVKILVPDDPDLAVSRGAAYYGSVLRGKGLRVRSATLFSYYLGVEAAMPAVPGMPPMLDGLCVVPAGTEEGASFDLPNAEFGLVVGETVDFRFFMSRHRPQDSMGALVRQPEQTLEALPSLEIHLPTEEGRGQRIIPVRLRAELTEIGTLELWCDALEGQKSWKLEFNLRLEDVSA